MSIRKVLCFIGAMTAVVSSGAIVRADSSADARKAIQLQYDRSNAAITRRDSTGTFAIYSPSFVAVDKNGKKHTLANLKQQSQVVFTQARIITGTTKIQTITLKGNTALVRVAEHSKMVGTDPATKSDSTLVFDSTSNDSWISTGGKWLQINSKTLTSKETINGRPFG